MKTHLEPLLKKQKSVAIIGGGYAGMAAAVRLAELGTTCTIFEAAKTLGGRARRVDYKGVTLDNGQHILSGAYTELLRLMALVGVPDTAYERVGLNLTFALPHLGAPIEFALKTPKVLKLPAPLHMAVALLTAKGLKWPERLAAIRLMQALKKSQFKVDANFSVAQLLAHHHQPAKLIQFLWLPLTISALNTPLTTASAQVFAHVLRDALAADRAASDLILPKVDLSQLFPEPAAGWLAENGSTVKHGVRVTAIEKSAGGFKVVFDNERDLKQEASVNIFSNIILAVAPHQLDTLTSSDTAIQSVFSSTTAHFQYEPITTIYLAFPASSTRTAQRASMPSPMLGKASGTVQWFFDRQALNGEAGLYAGVISASGAHESWPQDEMTAVALRELREWLPDLPAPLWHKVVHEKRATFACTPQIHRQRPATATAVRGLVLAGDYVACDYPATLEAAVRNGCLAADITHAHD